MRFRTAVLLVLLLCAVPAVSSENPWPRIRKARVQHLLPRAMQRAGVDAWVVFVRENDNDPLASTSAARTPAAPRPSSSSAKRALAGALSGGRGHGAPGRRRPHDEVVAPGSRRGPLRPRGRGARRGEARAHRGELLARPRWRTGSRPPSASARRRLVPRFAARLVSSEELVFEWLSVKLPEEVEIMRRAAALTASLQEEAYRTVVPGRRATRTWRASSRSAWPSWAWRTAGRRTRTPT